MALSLNTVLEVRTGGVDTNGGGFVTGASGTDWSQQNAAQYSVTDGVTAGTTTITSATANFGTDVVGNLIYVQGGTGSVTAGWYQITVRTNSTTITVDRSTGLTAGTGVTLKIGGALLSPGLATSLMTVVGMTCYVKNDGAVFSITSATVNIAGGCLGPTAQSNIIGYATTRTFNNTDTGPTIQTNVTTATTIQNTAFWWNITFDGNNQTACRLTQVGGKLIRCTFTNFNTASTSSNNGPDFSGCLATGNSAAVIGSLGNVASAEYCEAYGNTATPITAQYARNILTYDNPGASTDGIAPVLSSNGGSELANITAIGNGRDGIRIGGRSLVTNSVLVNNGAYGIGTNGSTGAVGINNAFYGNATGQMNIATAATYALGSITLTGDPFVSVAGDNYVLNNLAGAGAALRALAIPAAFPRGLTENFQDIGAAQHEETASVYIFPVFD